MSKDDDEIAESARSFGAEVPFLRPADLSGDDIGVVPLIRHGVEVLETSAGIRIRRLVHLHPTSPLRKSGHIDDAVNLHQRNKAETIIGVTAVPDQYTSECLFEIDQDCRFEAPGSGSGTLDRREKRNYYARNSPSILVLYRSTIAAGVFYGADTHALVMSETESIDLDTEDDFDLAEYLIKKSSA